MDDWQPIAEYIGNLCGAAKHDLNTANPADVGLNGVPIVGWREAYFEGCKDMANGIFGRVPSEHQEAFQAIARAAFEESAKEAALEAQEKGARSSTSA